MANTYITTGTRFKPFSFQEMLQPYQMYTEAYNKAEEELANLDIMAGDVASKLTNPLDKDLRKQYEGFQSELTSAMDDLYNKGLTPSTRKKLTGLKAKYTKDLNPINEAYKAYQTDQQYLAKMAIEHPEILIEGAGKSISDYLGGKTPQMRSVNTDDLMTEALNIAKTQAGRTYRESDWTSTAGGRFLERSVETGLNDIEFNNALAEVMSGNENLSANAKLIQNSINDIINTPGFQGLSEENQQKALNAVIKGVRAGFQYDKKTSTESDPMFAYNLKKRDELEKARAEAAKLEAERAGQIGSDYFITPDVTRQEIKNKFTHTYGINTGKFNEDYDKYFKNGKLLSPEEIEKETSKMEDEGVGLPYGTSYGYLTPYSTSNATGKQFYINDYNDLRDAFNNLGLDPSKADKDTFMRVLNSSDATGRKRAMITSNSTGFEHIQSNIERGLRNTETVEQIIGLNESSLGNAGTYKTKPVEYEKLLDDKGKLNILGVNMDYATGQRSVSLKTKDGYMEVVLPKGSGFRAEDPSDLAEFAFGLNTVQQGMVPIKTTNKKGEVVVDYIPLDESGYIPGTNILGSDYVSSTEQKMNLIFGDLFNYFGTYNTNK